VRAPYLAPALDWQFVNIQFLELRNIYAKISALEDKKLSEIAAKKAGRALPVIIANSPLFHCRYKMLAWAQGS